MHRNKIVSKYVKTVIVVTSRWWDYRNRVFSLTEIAKSTVNLHCLAKQDEIELKSNLVVRYRL